MSDDYLKGFDPLEDKENVSLEDKVEKYVIGLFMNVATSTMNFSG